MNGSSIQLADTRSRKLELAKHHLRARRGQVIEWAFKVTEFGLVQGFVQLFLAAAGLIIVRAMPKSEYAIFASTNSMQVASTQLADLGVGIGVRSIGGRVWSDQFRLGQLLNTALGLRRQFVLLSLMACLPIMAWLLRHNGAGVLETCVLCLTVAAGVIALLGASVWSISLLLHGDYRRVQKLDVANAGFGFALIGSLALTRIIAFLAALVGAVGDWVQVLFLRRLARELADAAAPANPDDRRELLRLSMKWLPNTIFYCFQGQVTFFILTLLGSPTGIADVTALGRLAALFTTFSVMFTNLLAPRFARCQEPARLGRLYLLLLGGTGLVLLSLFAAGWVFPGHILWLLGAKYAGLRQECAWVMGAGCLSQLNSVVWSLNMTKAWIRVQAFAYIPAMLAAQTIAAICLDLRQFHHVVIFNLIAVATPLPLYMLDAYFGFWPRRSRSALDVGRASKCQDYLH